MEIPIIGSDEPFLWGLWASIRGEIFDEIASSWNEVDRENKYGPYKGRLGNSLSVYPQTLNLKLKIVLQQVGNRPLFLVEDEQHVLGMQQKTGITREQAIELASILLHFGSRPGHV